LSNRFCKIYAFLAQSTVEAKKKQRKMKKATTKQKTSKTFYYGLSEIREKKTGSNIGSVMYRNGLRHRGYLTESMISVGRNSTETRILSGWVSYVEILFRIFSPINDGVFHERFLVSDACEF